MTLKFGKSLLKLLIGALTCALGAVAQTTPVLLQVELANIVGYTEDTTDLSKFATNPGVTPNVAVRNFGFQVHLADIVAVNGRPVKGTVVRNARIVALRTAPTPGQGIADLLRTGVTTDSFEFLNDDGSLIGTFAGSEPSSVPTASLRADAPGAGCSLCTPSVVSNDPHRILR